MVIKSKGKRYSDQRKRLISKQLMLQADALKQIELNL